MIERNNQLRVAGLKHDGNVHSNVHPDEVYDAAARAGTGSGGISDLSPEQIARARRITYGSPIRVGESGPAYRARLAEDGA